MQPVTFDEVAGRGLKAQARFDALDCTVIIGND
jgi:hypothetical protein